MVKLLDITFHPWILVYAWIFSLSLDFFLPHRSSFSVYANIVNALCLLENAIA